jgi:GDP-L-fucose synthase
MLKITAQDRIVVTGATGFLGSHVVPVLKKTYPAEIVPVSSKDYDLRREADVKKLFAEIKPTIIVHLAARVGGILSNKKYPVEFYYDNILINTHVVHEAYLSKVKKLLMTFGGCSYPANATSPIDESQMWNGYPQKESAAYSLAKKMQYVQSVAYRQEYGFNSISLIPGNLYGEYDNFSLEHSHVIPALIRKFYEAKRDGKPSVQLFGTGKPKRDFVYAGDVAAVVPYFLEQYDSSEPVNISTGTTTPIAELAETVKKYIGYTGAIQWDTSKPDGQMEKIFDVTRMRSLGLQCPTTLDEGLRRTIEWFIREYDRGGVRL